MENLKNIAPLADFDWEAFENGSVEAGASHEEQEKAYDETLARVTENEVVEGTVISITKREPYRHQKIPWRRLSLCRRQYRS